MLSVGKGDGLICAAKVLMYDYFWTLLVILEQGILVSTVLWLEIDASSRVQARLCVALQVDRPKVAGGGFGR